MKNKCYRYDRTTGRVPGIKIIDPEDGYGGEDSLWLKVFDQTGDSDGAVVSLWMSEGQEEDVQEAKMFLYRNGAEFLCKELARLLGWSLLSEPLSEL